MLLRYFRETGQFALNPNNFCSSSHVQLSILQNQVNHSGIKPHPFQALGICIATLRRDLHAQQRAPDNCRRRPFHNSKLYASLEQEDTKVWQYSTDMLYLFFKQEEKTGKIEFPDV